MIDVKAGTQKISPKEFPTFLYPDGTTYDGNKQLKKLFQSEIFLRVSSSIEKLLSTY